MKIPTIEAIDICIYHGPDCSDGFGAAWAVHDKLGDAVEYLPGDYVAGRYDADYWLGKVAGKRVACFDFSFQRELTEKLHAKARSFVIVDHHESAMEMLVGLDYCYYDLTRSGAVLAWRATHPVDTFANLDDDLPVILRYVQDQDCWWWQLPGSKEICTFINSQPHDFLTWSGMAKLLEEPEGRDRILLQGGAMLVQEGQYLSILRGAAEEWEIAGHKVMAVNCPLLRSQIGADLAQAEEYPFAAAYYIRNGVVVWSLRSRKGVTDVKKIALSFGGGGHTPAAGFSVPLERVDFANRVVK